MSNKEGAIMNNKKTGNGRLNEGYQPSSSSILGGFQPKKSKQRPAPKPPQRDNNQKNK